MKKSSFYLKMITSSILRRRSRMLVALLAIAIGATVLSGLVTIYYDVPRQMGKEMRSYGANLLLVSAGAESFSEAEFNRARSLIPSENVTGMTAFKYQNVTVNHQPFTAAGIDFDEVKKTSPFWLVSGDYPQNENEVLLGLGVAATVGAVAGDSISISGVAGGKPFERRVKVSGTLQTGGNEEEVIYISRGDLERITGIGGLLDVVECSVSGKAEELEKFAESIRSGVPSIKPEIVKRLANSENAVLSKLQSLVWIVTLVVMVLTMVCVATTMMAVVAERKQEIGLKKALGASNQEIVEEFLGEGLFLGALGGVLGVGMGYFFAQMVSLNVFARTISFSALIAPLTIFVSVFVTGLACLLPVRSTVDIDPALVLKGE